VKRRRLLLILLGCVASITLAVLVWPHERGPEPEYNGLTVSKWLDRWADGQSEGFVFAVAEMGTNATPFLLRDIGYRRPRWKAWLVGSIRYLPDPLVNDRCVDWLMKDKAENRADAAVFGFIALGRKAEPVLPELRRFANSKDSDTAGRANLCIKSITNRVNFDAQFDLDSLLKR
jgi:hypothetical protein